MSVCLIQLNHWAGIDEFDMDVIPMEVTLKSHFLISHSW